MMTSEEFVQKLENLVARPNGYNNHYPYNLCYYDGKIITADCWNLVKSLIWDPTIDQNYTVGRFAEPNIKETGLGDWTASEIIAACAENDPDSVSEDFSDISKIPPGAFLYYFNGSHAGVYIGDGKVVESTPIWDKGIQYTELSPLTYQGKVTGRRSKNNETRGRWTKWALLPWIDYD